VITNRAQRHWARWLPEQYAAIPDPGSFFWALGEEVAQQIGDLSLDLAGDDRPGEGYLDKLGETHMAVTPRHRIPVRVRAA
jgi:hypothetical protein